MHCVLEFVGRQNHFINMTVNDYSWLGPNSKCLYCIDGGISVFNKNNISSKQLGEDRMEVFTTCDYSTSQVGIPSLVSETNTLLIVLNSFNTSVYSHLSVFISAFTTKCLGIILNEYSDQAKSSNPDFYISKYLKYMH